MCPEIETFLLLVQHVQSAHIEVVAATVVLNSSSVICHETPLLHQVLLLVDETARVRPETCLLALLYLLDTLRLLDLLEKVGGRDLASVENLPEPTAYVYVGGTLCPLLHFYSIY